VTMKLAELSPERLGAWLVGTLRHPETPVELHVGPHGWELRCGPMEPFQIEPDPQLVRRVKRRRGS
jgi:hypothetical protein